MKKNNKTLIEELKKKTKHRRNNKNKTKKAYDLQKQELREYETKHPFGIAIKPLKTEIDSSKKSSKYIPFFSNGGQQFVR